MLLKATESQNYRRNKLYRFDTELTFYFPKNDIKIIARGLAFLLV